ncbi:MAG: MBOAT family O-acyltransferase, partial [Nannocystaceae bacterium]
QFGSLARRRFRLDDMVAGVQLIIWGLFKKVMIADHCGRIVDTVYGDGSATPDGWAIIVATYAFTLQIYCDFSAYSEIARGSARIFGVRLMQNFDQPYLTRSITDFWRRWHISLSEWFRDYVYIPLGGSRRGKARTLFNLTLTMFVSGLWHGAAWNFVIWGLFHGLLLLTGTLLGMHTGYRKLRERSGVVGDLVAWAVTLHLVVFGWLMFRVDNLAQFTHFTRSAGSALATVPTSVQLACLAAFFGFIACSAVERRLRLLTWVHASGARALCFHALLIITMLLFGARGGPQFIYFQF